jgi:hypothetical protein
MERLTGKKKGVVGLKDCLTECKHPINGCDCRNVRSALRRLAAYEDTGLSPEEIDEMQSKLTHLSKQLSGYVKQCLHYEKQIAKLKKTS